MSRIGRAPITVPAGVDIKIEDGNVVTVKGPKGEIKRNLCPAMELEVDSGVINVSAHVLAEGYVG